MTRIAMIADVHVANHKRWGGDMIGGLNARGRQCVATLRTACIRAKREGCEELFILGDLFDNSRPSPPLVSAVIGALNDGPHTTIILGNHDRQSMHDNDQACASMAWDSHIDVVTTAELKRFVNLEVAMLPYEAGLASEWLPTALSNTMTARPTEPGVQRIVLTHLGIWDERTPSYLKAASDAVGIGQVRFLGDAHKIDGFYAGNWHHYTFWPRDDRAATEVLIPGTVCPHSFSDASTPVGSTRMSVGGLVIYDTRYRGHLWNDIPGPRFVTCTLANVRSTPAGPIGGEWPTYYRLKISKEEMPAALVRRDSLEQSFDAHVDIEVIADSNELVRNVAREAVAASSGEIDSFADLVEIQEPGTRDGVMKRITAYKGSAGS